MNDKDKIIGDGEQIEAALQQFALTVASYYDTLVKNGVPDELARILTMSAQDALFCVFTSAFHEIHISGGPNESTS